MSELLSPKGLLVFSTGIFYQGTEFKTWPYLSDITHINIFSEKTFCYLEDKFNLEIIEKAKDLIVFVKN